MSTGEEFDSWEDIKRIDREWKQSWYEFGYQTLQKNIDDLDHELREDEVETDRLREQFWEILNSGIDPLETSRQGLENQEQLMIYSRIYWKKITKKECLCNEMARRKEEEDFQFIEDPKWMSFYYKAEDVIEKKFLESKQMLQRKRGLCGCGWRNPLLMQRGSHRQNDKHTKKAKKVCLHLMHFDQVLQILVKVIKFGEEWLVECIIPFLFPQLDWEEWDKLMKERLLH